MNRFVKLFLFSLPFCRKATLTALMQYFLSAKTGRLRVPSGVALRLGTRRSFLSFSFKLEARWGSLCKNVVINSTQMQHQKF